MEILLYIWSICFIANILLCYIRGYNLLKEIILNKDSEYLYWIVLSPLAFLGTLFILIQTRKEKQNEREN